MGLGPRREGYLNKKQELFCRFVAGGETLTAAYELAGYSPSTSNASTLANRADVKKRIDELKTEAREDQAVFQAKLVEAKLTGDQDLVEKNIEWSFGRIMDMIAEQVRLAQIAGEYGAANAALKMLGDGMNIFEKAKENARPPAQGPVTHIAQLVANLGSAGTNLPEEADNPLAPRLPNARRSD